MLQTKPSIAHLSGTCGPFHLLGTLTIISRSNHVQVSLYTRTAINNIILADNIYTRYGNYYNASRVVINRKKYIRTILEETVFSIGDSIHHE